MLDDLVNQIKANLYDRARSPLFGAFLIAWISWNFRTVLLIFSDGDATVKIGTVSKLYKTNLDYFCQGILYPLLSSAAFILIYPYLAKVAFWHWNKQHISIKKIQQNQEDETPATQEEINDLRKTSLAQQIVLQNEIRNLSNANGEFGQREKELINQINEYVKQQTVSGKTIDDLRSEVAKVSKLINSRDQTIDKLTSELDTLKVSKKPILKTDNSMIEYGNRKNNFLTFLNLFTSHNKLKSNKQYQSVIDDILNYCHTHSVSIDILKIIFLISWNDGKLAPAEIKRILGHDMSSVEISDLFNKLKKMNFTYTNNRDELVLDENGTAFAVASKITSMIKQMIKAK